MPAPFNPDDWVYTVDELTFTVDDKEYPVSRVSFAAFDNEIPAVTLRIAAVESVDTTIQAITVPQLIKYQNELQKKAGVDGVKTLVKFKITSPKDTQELELNDWVIQTTGLEPVGASGDVAASVTLRHKALLTTKATLNLYNYANDIEQPSSISGGNIYELFLSAVDLYLEEVGDAAPVENYSDVGDVSVDELNEISLERVTKAMEDLKEAIEWGDDDATFPYDDISLDMETLLAPALWDYAQLEGFNPYSALDVVLGDFLLRLAGTFNNDKLQITPYTPWGKSVGFITDDEISSLTLPPTDPAILSGVICKFGSGKYTEYGFLPPAYVDNVKAGADVSTEQNNKLGGYLKHVRQLLGPIKAINLPSWLSSIFKRESNTGATYEEQEINPDEDTVDTSAAASDYADLSAEIYEMASVYAEDVFYQYYREKMQIAFNTRFMLKNKNVDTPDNLLRPGETMHIQSIDDDEPLLYFYVNRVEHIIDAQAGSAYSRFAGSYVRPAEGIEGTDDDVITESQIKDGIPNKSYAGDDDD